MDGQYYLDLLGYFLKKAWNLENLVFGLREEIGGGYDSFFNWMYIKNFQNKEILIIKIVQCPAKIIEA